MKRFVFPLLTLIALIPAVSRAEEIFSVDKNTVLRIEQDCTLTFNINYKSEKSPPITAMLRKSKKRIPPSRRRPG